MLFSVHSVLFIMLKTVLFCSHVWIKNYPNGEYIISFIDWRIRKRMIFNNFLSMANKYIHICKHILKECKISFCRQGRLSHCKSVNLLCSHTIWLFTAFPQINVSNSQQSMCVKIHLSIMVAHFYSWQKIQMNRRISKQAYGNLNWVFLSHWYNLFNYLHYYIYLSLSKKQRHSRSFKTVLSGK